MTIAPTTRDFESALEKLDLRMARRKRWAIALIGVPAALAVLLVTTSLNMVRTAAIQTAELESRASAATAREHKARAELTRVEQEVTDAKRALESTRQAASNLGIALFHQRNYREAIKAYDSALAVDPGNVYLVNLKGYAYFKLKDYSTATAILRAAVRKAPQYAYGYFDLARVQCAQGDFVGARTSAKRAIDIDPGIRTEMAADGEFMRLCRSLLTELGLPKRPTE